MRDSPRRRDPHPKSETETYRPLYKQNFSKSTCFAVTIAMLSRLSHLIILLSRPERVVSIEQPSLIIKTSLLPALYIVKKLVNILEQ